MPQTWHRRTPSGSHQSSPTATLEIGHPRGKPALIHAARGRRFGSAFTLKAKSQSTASLPPPADQDGGVVLQEAGAQFPSEILRVPSLYVLLKSCAEVSERHDVGVVRSYRCAHLRQEIADLGIPEPGVANCEDRRGGFRTNLGWIRNRRSSVFPPETGLPRWPGLILLRTLHCPYTNENFEEGNTLSLLQAVSHRTEENLPPPE